MTSWSDEPKPDDILPPGHGERRGQTHAKDPRCHCGRPLMVRVNSHTGRTFLNCTMHGSYQNEREVE